MTEAIRWPVGWLLTSTPWKKIAATGATAVAIGGLGYGTWKNTTSGGGGGVPPGTANLWVESGAGACARSSSPVDYTGSASPDARCGAFDTAYQAAACGDEVLIKGGSYGSQTITRDAGLTGCSTDITFRNAEGETVNMSGATLAFDGATHVAVIATSQAQFVADGSPSLSIDCSGANRATDITVENINFSELHIDSLNGGILRGNDFGPTHTTAGDNNEPQIIDNCGLGASNNMLIENNVFHDATSDGAGHTSCLMVPWLLDSTFRGNTFARCDNEGLFIKAGWQGGAPWLRNITIESNFFASACTSCGTGPDGGLAINHNGTEGTAGNPYTGFVIRGNSFHGPSGLTFNNGNNTTFTSSVFTGNILSGTTDGRTGTTCADGLTSAYNVFIGSAPDVCGTNTAVVTSYPWVNTLDTTSLNYHLTGSTGTADNYVPTSVTGGCAPTDIDGTSRPVNTNCDAGGDER